MTNRTKILVFIALVGVYGLSGGFPLHCYARFRGYAMTYIVGCVILLWRKDDILGSDLKTDMRFVFIFIGTLLMLYSYSMMLMTKDVFGHQDAAPGRIYSVEGKCGPA